MGDAGPKTKPQKRGSTSPWMPRLRKRGEKLLHSKYVVILVIILTIVDCSLVIAELILDLYSVKKTLSTTEDQTFKFIRSIRLKYPEEVKSNDSVFSVFDRITHASILWNNTNQLDFQLMCHNLGIDSSVMTSMGKPIPSLSSIYPFRNSESGERDSDPKSILLQNRNTPEISSKRFRRAYRNNVTFVDRKSNQDNEEWTRTKPEYVLRKYLYRVRRYLSTSINTLSQQLFQKRNTPYDSANKENKYDDNYNNNDINNDINNETIRLLNDLVILRQQLSDYYSMQHRQFDSVDQVRVFTNSISSIDNDDVDETDTSNFSDGSADIQSDISYDEGNDRSAVGNDRSAVGNDRSHVVNDRSSMNSDISGDSIFSTVISSDYSTDDSQSNDDGFEDVEETGEAGNIRRKRNIDDYEASMRRELHHSKEMEIAHKLHYASVCVVSILVIEVTLKIVCAGSHFLKRKIEVFDAVVIVTSVVVDLIFIKGLSEFAVDDSIFVLALLLPWRVIRVVNSLVMAVIDHEHVKLRLLYSRKKKLDKTVENLRNEVDELKGMLQDIRSFCIKEGIDPSRIDGMLGKFAPRRRKDSKFYTLVKLVMSTASINNNDNDSVSSSSIENDLRHYSNRDSILNEAASNDGTISSLKGYLSVPFCNGDSRSISEAESIAEDHINASPSIYITSPANDIGDAMFSFCDVEMGDNEIINHHDTSECIEEEDDSVATIDITSNTTNTNTMNGVAFYVGSQNSFNYGSSQGTIALTENDEVHNESLHISTCRGVLRESVSSNTVDANKNSYSNNFGQYLTVPHCTVSVCSGTNTLSISSSNNNNASSNVSTAISSLPHGSQNYQMRRSVSDSVTDVLGTSSYDGLYPPFLYGSPIPVRRLPEDSTLRKTITKYTADSEDNEAITPLKHDSQSRLRRNSGEPKLAPASRAEEPKRARSHSPSPMVLLSVPGNDRTGNDVTCSSSRSMNDVTSVENPYGHKLGGDGKILRRSCLSLNSEGRKRRKKSPHRVSFKVS